MSDNLKDHDIRNAHAFKNPGKRRIVVPPKKEPMIHAPTSCIPAVDLLLHDAKAIIASELAYYRQKTSRGITLDLKEARAVQNYLETLIKLQKEEREASRAQDLSNLSNEELLDLATKLLGYNQPNQDKKE